MTCVRFTVWGCRCSITKVIEQTGHWINQSVSGFIMFLFFSQSGSSDDVFISVICFEFHDEGRRLALRVLEARTSTLDVIVGWTLLTRPMKWVPCSDFPFFRNGLGSNCRLFSNIANRLSEKADPVHDSNQLIFHARHRLLLSTTLDAWIYSIQR